MKKLVYGVGINDADYVIGGKNEDGLRWVCPYYLRWVNLLRRCYSKGILLKNQTYIGCTICEEWKYFMNFRSWMEKQDWKGKELDKDFLVQGNKKYGPDNCVFISSQLNSMLTDSKVLRGEYPLGVCWHKQNLKFQARVAVMGKNRHLGYYTTPEAAHRAWQQAKLELIKGEIGNHKDSRVDVGLQARVDQLHSDIDNNRITIKL